MESEELRNKTIWGMIWNFAEKFSLQLFGFMQGIILARLLMPSDYGLVAMTGIFFSISYSLIDSGFTQALIRKQNRTSIDYSTVYVTNITLSFLFACLLASCSTLIANFYNQPILTKIVCVNALYMFVNSFIAVQGTKLTIQLDFKIKSKINVTATIVIGIATIILAYMGFGVWALIYPNFLGTLIRGCLYWHYQHWFPGFLFSWKSCKEFFSFGSKLLVSGLLNTIYTNIYPLIIGKQFTANDLGYYQKANDYSALPSTTITNVLATVTFPVLSTIQDNEERLRFVYRKLIRLSGYVVFPTMTGLAALAKPFIVCLITEKWAYSIPYLQILCFSLMWYPIHALNLNLLQVKGRSDLFLRLEIIKKIIGLSVLFFTIRWGILSMCIGSVITSLLCLFVNTYYTGILIKVNFIQQMKDLTPSILYSLSMGALVWLLAIRIASIPLQLTLGVLLGIAYYIGVSWITKSSELSYLLLIIKENLLKKNGH